MSIETAGYFITGLTDTGHQFRPSDWVERIAGNFANFDANRRMRYHPLVRPAHHEGKYGLFVASELASTDPFAYQFVMNFVSNYQLAINAIGQTTQLTPLVSLPYVA